MSDRDRPAGRYETADAPAARIALVAPIMVVVLAAAALALWGLLALFRPAPPAPGFGPSRLERAAREIPPPRLQVDPQIDLEALRAQQAERLSSYGWVDRERNIVHIPIDEAMDRLAERGWSTEGGP